MPNFFGLFKIVRVRRRVRRKKSNTKEYLQYREAARALVHARLEHFNGHYGFSYKKVFIKNQKTRWGSCSNRANLNFSYRIVFLSPAAQDYLIVHELCHLKEFNHSKDFWNLVGETIPEYQVLRNELRMHDLRKMKAVGEKLQ